MKQKYQRGGILFTLIAIVGFAALCAALYLFRFPILRGAAQAWMIEDHIEKADAILLLSDDNFAADRATQAAQLYRQRMAPTIVASGRRLRPYAGIAELMEHDLIERGVPKEAIVRVPQEADSTPEEAEKLLELTKQRKWQRVIVVTSNVDARRVRYIFRRLFPKEVDVRVSGARDLDFDPDHWWETRGGVERMIHEVAGMAIAIWELSGREVGLEASQPLVEIVPPIPQYVV